MKVWFIVLGVLLGCHEVAAKCADHVDCETCAGKSEFFAHCE